MREWRPGSFIRDGESVAIDGVEWVYTTAHGCGGMWLTSDGGLDHLELPPFLRSFPCEDTSARELRRQW